MPDWSYQTLFRPALFRLSSEKARAFTLNAMSGLSRIPGGTFVIRTLGHMESSSLLESGLEGIRIKYPVGLSGTLDIHGTANKAMAPFGFGFFEVGPITVGEITGKLPVQRDAAGEAIIYPEPYINDGLEKTVRRMSKKQGHRLPLFFRIRPMPGSKPDEAYRQLRQLMAELAPFAAAFYIDALDESWPQEATAELLNRVRLEARATLGAAAKPLLLYVPLDAAEGELKPLLCGGIQAEAWDGIVLGEAVRTSEGALVGKAAKAPSLVKARFIRELCGTATPIIVTGGVHEPQDALDLLEAGATYVQLHSGLVYSGPGLPKRINEAVIHERLRREKSAPPLSFWSGWGWMCLLGIGMMLGGLLAWIIAATHVVLPYDMAFLGLDRSGISEANARLLSFMSHDRVTLAGTMISIGILYFQLARYGLRYGQHWAKTALMTSGLVGFSSFFLYLGYGYFDPLHALAAAILLPMFVLSMRAGADRPPQAPPSLRNDRVWLRAQWGQLMLVMLGFSLAVGGIVISTVGVTDVFVPQDLEYLCASPEMLDALNERLIPLIAHDRAGFGGALLSDALALLIMALWGINQGARWLWWTFAIGGFPGFLAGFSVHFHIGYTDFVHLLPAYFAFALYVAGLVLLYPYMMRKGGGPA